MVSKKNKVEEDIENKTVDTESNESKENEETTVETNEEASDVASNEESLNEEATDDNEATKKDKKDLMIEELNDKYMRTFAEFDNFRKRTEREKAAMFEVGAKSIVEKILPIIDSFERGLATVNEEQKNEPFVEGMDKVYKQLMTTLSEAGVKPIEALNEQFNPDFHNAVMHVEDDSLEENIIVEEFQKGYMYHDSVVRHSMVKVAN